MNVLFLIDVYIFIEILALNQPTILILRDFFFDKIAYHKINNKQKPNNIKNLISI